MRDHETPGFAYETFDEGHPTVEDAEQLREDVNEAAIAVCQRFGVAKERLTEAFLADLIAMLGQIPSMSPDVTNTLVRVAKEIREYIAKRSLSPEDKEVLEIYDTALSASAAMSAVHQGAVVLRLDGALRSLTEPEEGD